jgi:ABC-2 type transport system permease protein
MNKTWLVIKHEYLLHVKKKRFIFAILSLPLFILLMVGVGFISVIFQYNSTPIGYIDHTGYLHDPIENSIKAPIGFLPSMEIITFTSGESAQNSLNNNEIQAYYIMPVDFLQTGKIKVFANEIPDSEINTGFTRFLRSNLLRSLPDKISNRVTEGASFEIKSTTDNRNTSEDSILGFVLPFLAGFLFIMAVNISGGYLMQAVVEEKENRTMEIMITSLSPTQLMTAKVIGNLSVGLTQLIVWILVGMIGFVSILRIYPTLQTSQIDFSFLILMILVFLPAFVMIAAMMAALGATTTESREAQQFAGLFTIPMVLPFWFIQVLMEKPNSILSIFLSIFPFTAPISLPVRAAFSTIPTWQIIITIALLISFAIAALWLAGKAFRLGMLRYGKKLTIKEIFTQRP